MQSGPEKKPEQAPEAEESRRLDEAAAGETAPEGTEAPETADAATDGAGTAGFSAEDLVPGLADAVVAEEITALTARAEAAEAERDELKDRLLRALAEVENIRRRAERDRKDAATYGGTKLARDLLSVLDNMERAMAAADDALRENHAAFLEGVEMTRRELLNAFAKHEIQPISPEKGEKFDPNRHQAMFEAPIPGATPGTVIEVMQTGFTIADRLLRPALVGVAKATSQPAEPPKSETDGEEAPAHGEDRGGA